MKTHYRNNQQTQESDDGAAYIPTEEEYRKAIAEVQSWWSEKETYRRQAVKRTEFTIPRVIMFDKNAPLDLEDYD